MAGLMDLLNSDLGKQIISGVGQQAGTNPTETTAVLSAALPTLLGAMQNNASSPAGASGLLGALLGGKHDGLLDNLTGFLGSDNFAEGGKILGHVLGDNQANVQNSLSQNTGVGTDKIASILKIAAPILMSFLANQTKSTGVSSGTDLGGLLGGLLGNSNTNTGTGSVLTSLLDQDGDGQLGIGDAVSAMSKKGGIGGLLGGLFGK